MSDVAAAMHLLMQRLAATEAQWRAEKERADGQAVQTYNAERALSLHGFRRCDVAACGCGSWHQHENPRAERMERERDEARAEVARLNERMEVVLRAGPSTAVAVSVFDRAARLEAEVERLRARLDQVTAERDGAVDALDHDGRLRSERDEARAEVERLQGELGTQDADIIVTKSALAASQAVAEDYRRSCCVAQEGNIRLCAEVRDWSIAASMEPERRRAALESLRERCAKVVLEYTPLAGAVYDRILALPLEVEP